MLSSTTIAAFVSLLAASSSVVAANPSSHHASHLSPRALLARRQAAQHVDLAARFVSVNKKHRRQQASSSITKREGDHHHNSSKRLHKRVASGEEKERRERSLNAKRSPAAGDPSMLANGADTTAEGCTKFYRVEKGEYCYKVCNKFDISLKQFYKMNPGLDSKCSNLWAGYDYCVSKAVAKPKTTTTTVAPTTTTTVAVVTTTVPPVKIVAKSTTTTTTVTPKATKKASTVVAAAKVSEDDDDDEDCGVDEVDASASASASTSAPTSHAAAAAPTSQAKVAAAAPAAPASHSSSSSVAAAAASTAQASTNLIGNVLAKAGVTQFLGANTGIASWFRTDSSQDSTNGHSWCGFPYDDSTPGFAPSVGTMLGNFGGNYEAAATAYCGLEAEFTTPSGRTATLYIADGFDDKWVLTPGSVDVVVGSFPLLYGSTTDNKDDVVQGVTWKLTGNRNPQYVFKGQGSG